jgi:hypothetical protein
MGWLQGRLHGAACRKRRPGWVRAERSGMGRRRRRRRRRAKFWRPNGCNGPLGASWCWWSERMGGWGGRGDGLAAGAAAGAARRGRGVRWLFRRLQGQLAAGADDDLLEGLVLGAEGGAGVADDGPVRVCVCACVCVCARVRVLVCLFYGNLIKLVVCARVRAHVRECAYVRMRVRVRGPGREKRLCVRVRPPTQPHRKPPQVYVGCEGCGEAFKDPCTFLKTSAGSVHFSFVNFSKISPGSVHFSFVNFSETSPGSVNFSTTLAPTLARSLARSPPPPSLRERAHHPANLEARIQCSD